MAVDIYPIPLGFDTCYVLRSAGVVVLDAGQPRKGWQFREGLSVAGVDPREVRLILLTHAHWDHMGSAAELKAITGAPLAVHEREVSWVEGGNPPLPRGATRWGKPFMAAHRLAMPFISVPPAAVDLQLGSDTRSLESYGIPGVVVHTPGHSPGSVSVLLDSGEAFVGDLAMNRIPLTRRPGLPIFADSLDEVARSWERLLEMGVTTVHPAHGRPFPVADIERVLDRRVRPSA